MGHDDLHEFAVPFEPESCEIGEDRACRGRRMLCWVRSRLRGYEKKPKSFEAGQCGEGGDTAVTIASGEKYPECGMLPR